jgi:hypothetical protein
MKKKEILYLGIELFFSDFIFLVMSYEPQT